jgi:hypothetical protein
MTDTAAVVAVARKDGEVGLEIHAVGCADFARGKRAVQRTFASVAAAFEDYYDDMIREGQMTIEEALTDSHVLPCVKAVR